MNLLLSVRAFKGSDMVDMDVIIWGINLHLKVTKAQGKEPDSGVRGGTSCGLGKASFQQDLLCQQLRMPFLCNFSYEIQILKKS